MTKKFLADQVLLKLGSGYPDIAQNIKIFDVIAAVGQVANSLLKAQYVSDILGSGERVPNNLVIAEYPPIDIKLYGDNKSYFMLPATPISLPRNMGVFAVSLFPDFSDEVIPIQAGQGYFLKDMDILDSELLYEPSGNRINLSRNVLAHGYTKAYVKLAILDISLYDENVNLPLPADFENPIINTVYQMFAPIPQTVRVTDGFQPQQKV